MDTWHIEICRRAALTCKQEGQAVNSQQKSTGECLCKGITPSALLGAEVVHTHSMKGVNQHSQELFWRGWYLHSYCYFARHE